MEIEAKDTLTLAEIKYRIEEIQKNLDDLSQNQLANPAVAMSIRQERRSLRRLEAHLDQHIDDSESN